MDPKAEIVRVKRFSKSVSVRYDSTVYYSTANDITHSNGAKAFVLVYVLLENVCVAKINYVIMFPRLFVCQH